MRARRQADQALAVPAKPASGLDPSGFDPSRWASVLTRQERQYLIATPMQEPAEAGFIARRSGDFCGHGTPFSGFARRRPALFQRLWNSCGNKRLYRLTAAGVAVRDAAIAMEAAKPSRRGTGSTEGDSAGPKDIAQKDTPHD